MRTRTFLYLILLACIFDLLDGRVARIGGYESPFGREFDSLADIISFGAAPAFLVHRVVLRDVFENYAAVGWLRTPAAQDLVKRGRVHVITGLVWAGCVAQIAAVADHAGPMREALLLMATAASVVCIFFTAPWLPSLLIVGAAAAAGPHRLQEPDLVRFVVQGHGRAFRGRHPFGSKHG